MSRDCTESITVALLLRNVTHIDAVHGYCSLQSYHLTASNSSQRQPSLQAVKAASALAWHGETEARCQRARLSGHTILWHMRNQPAAGLRTSMRMDQQRACSCLVMHHHVQGREQREGYGEQRVGLASLHRPTAAASGGTARLRPYAAMPGPTVHNELARCLHGSVARCCMQGLWS